MATLRPLTLTGSCRPGQAGISRAAFVDFNDVDSVDFDANKNLTALNLGAGKTWTEIQFEDEGTGFLNAEFSSNKSSINWAVDLTFIVPVVDENAWLVDYEIGQFCNLVGIVLTNQNRTRVCGLEWVSGTNNGSFKKRGFKKTAGSDNSGADPTADSAELTFTFTANQGVSPHHWLNVDWSNLSFTQ